MNSKFIYGSPPEFAAGEQNLNKVILEKYVENKI